MADKETSNVVELDHDKIGVIELPTVDLKPYIGKKAVVESIQSMEGQHGKYIRVTSVPVEVVNKGKENEFSITAGIDLGLQKDADGNIGWGEDTKMGKFLKAKKLKHYKELVGMELTMQLTTPNKDGKQYLTFA